MAFRTGKQVVGITGDSSAPNPGELEEPIVLVRSARVPDNSVGFDLNLTPYFRCWAKVSFGEASTLNGQDTDDKKWDTMFKIRNNQELNIEIRDVVSWKDELFRIVSTKMIGKKRDYLQIKTQSFTLTDGATFTVLGTENGDILVDSSGRPLVTNQPAGPTTSVQSPFWEEGPDDPNPAEGNN